MYLTLLECIGDYGSDKCLLDSKIPMFYVQHPVIEAENNGVRYTKKLPTRFYLCYDRRIGSGNKVIETVYKSPSL